MRFGQVGRLLQRLAVHVGGVGRAVRVLEHDREVEQQRRVAPAVREAVPIYDLGVVVLLACVQQAAEVRVCADMLRIDRQRPPIELDRCDGVRFLGRTGLVEQLIVG